MKNLKTIIAIVALGLATVIPTSANNEKELSVKSELRSKIVTLLGQYSYTLEKQETAKVSLMLNNKNELVVISVNSDNETITKYVKTKLNYKKISVKGLSKGVIYRIPIKMAQSS